MSNAEPHVEDEEDEYLYGETIAERKEQTTQDAQAESSAEPMSEESDDSDIEFIIETKPGERAEPPGGTSTMYGVSKPGLRKPAERPTVEVKSMEPQDTSAAAETAQQVDINPTAKIDGKNIFEVDLESLEDKPWRKPGADISDYFNYGFDEFTWAAYCAKQTTLRDDFSPQKFMASLMGGAMPSGDMPNAPDFQAMMPGFPPFMPMPPPPIAAASQDDLNYSRPPFPIPTPTPPLAGNVDSASQMNSGANTPSHGYHGSSGAHPSNSRENESPARSPNHYGRLESSHGPYQQNSGGYGGNTPNSMQSSSGGNYAPSRGSYSDRPHNSNYSGSSRRRQMSPDRYGGYSNSRGNSGRYRRNRYN
ncbi:mRNA cleavage and polyadenylation specificity factor complex subunit [Schizosaccharomyces octosporus yFS286]|uniref:mRNA cleavage and polyadenylation specificity factor complex subunit n=1 Tax=Schizosaccharomyces octosporus (strain yFS286) TaxID=483514 RepID=S9R8N1_SCHOY|nr:mRNA cleavage and polyadenylation specificity factor complex subunit [Schizosaccharomyces octosporus yFS286]EPX74550.1 mRNA cleavage and polyadenylation specificity factor complex subunit [Schizosaccharomyces octosporus yFS286]